MAKKLSVLFAAIALLAFAVPATASASTGLTQSGTLLPVGSDVTLTNVGVVTITSSIGNPTCSSMIVLGEVAENSEATGFKIVGIGEGSATICFWKGSVPIEMTRVDLIELSSSMAEVGTGKGSFSFEADLKPGVLTCRYTASGAAFTYTPETDKITFLKAKLTATPAACGSATFDAEFELTTPNGTAVNIM